MKKGNNILYRCCVCSRRCRSLLYCNVASGKDIILNPDDDGKSTDGNKKSSETEMENTHGKLASGLLLLSISLARIGSGLFISIHGPTLLTLANNVGSPVGDVSWLFSGRSLGLLLGGMATGPIMRRTNNLLGFGLTCLLLSAVVIATPWITALWLLVVVVMFGGIFFGYLDAGMQALILQLWGEKESRGFISGYHFMIAVGAFLAPIIAQPFLAQQDDSERCPASNQGNPSATTAVYETTMTSSNQTTIPKETDPINPVVWAYLVCGCVLVFIALFFFALFLWKLESRVRNSRGTIVEDREEDSIKGLIYLFILICVYYFFCVAGETSYNSYIYSISICSELSFEASLGTVINSLFWVGFGLGRLGGVIFLRYISPRNVILIDLVGTIVCMIVVSIFGEKTPEVTWAVTFLYGFFQATIYPAGVSWASKYTNMSGNYIFIFSAGQALGTMTLVPVGGIIFDFEPFNVMFLVLGCSVGNAIAFALMMIEGRRLKRRSRWDSLGKRDSKDITTF